MLVTSLAATPIMIAISAIPLYVLPLLSFSLVVLHPVFHFSFVFDLTCSGRYSGNYLGDDHDHNDVGSANVSSSFSSSYFSSIHLSIFSFFSFLTSSICSLFVSWIASFWFAFCVGCLANGFFCDDDHTSLGRSLHRDDEMGHGPLHGHGYNAPLLENPFYSWSNTTHDQLIPRDDVDYDDDVNDVCGKRIEEIIFFFASTSFFFVVDKMMLMTTLIAFVLVMMMVL